MQDALHGYLSAFPFEHFERLQSLSPVWAPFYVVRAPHAQAVLQLCLSTCSAARMHASKN